MELKPLADRVLILPDTPPETTESGLILRERWKPEQTGTVVAVGTRTCPRCGPSEPEMKAGDYVVFSWQAGQEIWVNHGEARYLLLRQEDVLAVVEGVS